MFRLDFKVRVEDGVELNSDIGCNLCDRSKVEEPAEEINRACKEAEDAAVLDAWGYGGIMIDAAC